MHFWSVKRVGESRHHHQWCIWMTMAVLGHMAAVALAQQSTVVANNSTTSTSATATTTPNTSTTSSSPLSTAVPPAAQPTTLAPPSSPTTLAPPVASCGNVSFCPSNLTIGVLVGVVCTIVVTVLAICLYRRHLHNEVSRNEARREAECELLRHEALQKQQQQVAVAYDSPQRGSEGMSTAYVPPPLHVRPPNSTGSNDSLPVSQATTLSDHSSSGSADRERDETHHTAHEGTVAALELGDRSGVGGDGVLMTTVTFDEDPEGHAGATLDGETDRNHADPRRTALLLGGNDEGVEVRFDLL